MTTVAYRDGVLAADTLGCSHIRRHCKKLHRVGDSILGFSGNYMDCLHFVRWFEKKDGPLTFANFRNDNSDAPDVAAIVVCNGEAEKWTEHCQPTPIYEPFFAIGSGAQAAMAAMHMGASAKEAVKIAMLIDPHTAGEVETLSD